MLPLFPRFKVLTLNDKSRLEEITNLFPPYSDFNFVSLFTWGANRSSSASILDNNLVIRLRDYTEEGFIYSVIGRSNIGQAVHKLLTALEGRLELVPEDIVKHLQGYKAEPQRDEDDYVYNIRSLVSMEGPGYRNFRRALSNFESKNPGLKIGVQKIAHEDENSKNQAAELTRQWRSVKRRSFKEASNEYFAIKRALRFSKELDLNILGIYSENQLIGFTITESIGEWAILHFEKTAGNIPGLGAYLKMQAFKSLSENGNTLLNYEQDLGILGLRQAKMSLCPERFLKKFRVSMK